MYLYILVWTWNKQLWLCKSCWICS